MFKQAERSVNTTLKVFKSLTAQSILTECSMQIAYLIQNILSSFRSEYCLLK